MAVDVEGPAVSMAVDVKGPAVSMGAGVKGPAVSMGASAVTAALLGPDGKVDRDAALERLKLLTQVVPLVKEQLELQQKQLVAQKSSKD